ncbi:hypothetical protein MKW94_003572, partial [Papaver nudicaule]|nr:hypothetical protein [Papaver nudicaule]
ILDLLSTSVLTLENMTQLEMGYCESGTLLKFLQFTPNMESLAVTVSGSGVNEDAFTLNLVPHCLLLHLKKIEVRDFTGHPQELKFVKYFWKNARILQVLIIQSGTSKSIVELETETQIMEVLLKYHRADIAP